VTGDRQKTRVCVARIGAAHGLRGEVRLNSFTADPLAVTRYGPLQAEDGARAFEIETCRQGKSFLVVRFKGIADRDAAERLCNLDLYVPRQRLPQAEAGEFYHADLIGLRAVTADGSEIGTVVAVQNFGAGDLLEIAPSAGGTTMLLPFTEAIVPKVDIAGGLITVVPPAVLSDREERDPPP
jgi:16S rRNA processing protein RimM